MYVSTELVTRSSGSNQDQSRSLQRTHKHKCGHKDMKKRPSFHLDKQAPLVTWWLECVPAGRYECLQSRSARSTDPPAGYSEDNTHIHTPQFTYLIYLASSVKCLPTAAKLTDAAKIWAAALWGFHWTVPTSHLLCRPIFLGGSDGASRFTI